MKACERGRKKREREREVRARERDRNVNGRKIMVSFERSYLRNGCADRHETKSSLKGRVPRFEPRRSGSVQVNSDRSNSVKRENSLT